MEVVGLLADVLLIWQGFLIGSFQLDVEPLWVVMKVLTSWTIHFPVVKVNLSVHILLGRWLIGRSHYNSNSYLNGHLNKGCCMWYGWGLPRPSAQVSMNVRV